MATIHVLESSRSKDNNYHHTPAEEDGDDEDGGDGMKEETNYDWDGRGRGGGRKRSAEWNRAFLLVCAAGLVVDPLFVYPLSISDACMCLFVDGWFAAAVTALRCVADAVRLLNICLQFDARMKRSGSKRRHAAAWSYLINNGFILEFFLILPLPQIVVWVAIPRMVKNGSPTRIMTLMLIVFLGQYLPKMYHFVRWRMPNLYGYTVWRGIALNMTAYCVASHQAVGACWYLLGLQRAAQCLDQQCAMTQGCRPTFLACEGPILYGTSNAITSCGGSGSAVGRLRTRWAEVHRTRTACSFDGDGSDGFAYGTFEWSVQLVSNPNPLEKILLPIFWGLMTLSSFGNLNCTTDGVEVVFMMVVLTAGLLLVTMLIGSIKMFFNSTSSKKQAMHLRMRSIEGWMKKRGLPLEVRQRVRNYERQRWAAMRGVDERQMIGDLPQGLRRDIKFHLCFDLIRQVPLFQHMDNLVLEHICDRVRTLILTKGETITREGDPVQRMLFIVRGHLECYQHLRDDVSSFCMLGPGNFTGDELLSWCLRRRHSADWLPPSSFTLVTVETTEAFGLEADDVKYVTQHFRHTFVSERVKRSARYYSPGWRTWAAVAIQLAWRRYKRPQPSTLSSLPFMLPRRPPARSTSVEEDRLRLYTALLTSSKPHEDAFDF
ncbi:hypothetical protein DM860_008664 [Cuscuta australis]|uniref:Cyclic nucleotide-binding domain-containing protein n=1 Tax=Cuscuta australis TaxID=267555 RepID=A0A328D5Y7_9ASTE|nr:hypothetical protein DM860_008664 [Cuscuta australis]